MSFLFICSGVNAQAYKTQPVKLKASVYEKAVPADTSKVQATESEISGSELVALINSAPESLKGAKVLLYNGHNDTSAMRLESNEYFIFILRNKNIPESESVIIKILESPNVFYKFDPKKWVIVNPYEGY